MNLSNTEKEMIQMMRAQEAGQRHLDNSNTGEPTYKQVTGNLVSTLDAALSAALLSEIPQVREEAQVYLSEIRSNGASNLQDANEKGLLSDNSLQTLINSTSKASALDPSVNYTAVAETATFYNSGATDEDLANIVKSEMKELRNTDRGEIWDTVTNPNTGGKIQVNSKNGEVRKYIDALDDMEAVAAENDVQFLEYVAQGNPPENFGSSLNGNPSLKVI